MPRPNKYAVPSDLRWKLLWFASQAKCDPRVVRDYITGRRRTRAAQAEAIERVLREAGRDDLIRSQVA